jgi:hypothetical protein
MTIFWTFVGTFIMLAGSALLVLGLGVLRVSQEALGRMYLSMTSVGGSENPSTGFMGLLADIRGNDALKRRKALQFIGAGLFVGLLGAAVVRW